MPFFSHDALIQEVIRVLCFCIALALLAELTFGPIALEHILLSTFNL